MISSVELENWRSFASLTVPLESLTALVGLNGVGKSGVLAAIDFALGARWPGRAYLDVPRDFHSLDTSSALRIRCNLSPPLVFADSMKTAHNVGCLEYRCQPYGTGPLLVDTV